MLAALILSGALATFAQGATPPDYTERSLCEVWAGAKCHQTQCLEDGKERCTAESRRCRELSSQTVTREQAARVVECARAILKQKCGAPSPEECAGVQLPHE